MSEFDVRSREYYDAQFNIYKIIIFKYLMCILMSINKGVCYVGVGDKID